MSEKIDCDHIGNWNPPSSVIVDLGAGLVLFVSANCHQCGHIETVPQKIKLDKGVSIPQISQA